jgi:hypothetical protein
MWSPHDIELNSSMRTCKIHEAIIIDLEIGFGHGHSRWKYIDKQNPSKVFRYEQELN